MHAHLRVSAALTFVLTALSACGGEPTSSYDWRNRELPWTYAPTTGTASPEHLTATGKQGPGAISQGWKCRLTDGKQVTITPFRLDEKHALLGKVAMNVGLFDKTGKMLETFRSEALTADNATVTFAVPEASAKVAWDLVIKFRGV